MVSDQISSRIVGSSSDEWSWSAASSISIYITSSDRWDDARMHSGVLNTCMRGVVRSLSCIATLVLRDTQSTQSDNYQWRVHINWCEPGVISIRMGNLYRSRCASPTTARPYQCIVKIRRSKLILVGWCNGFDQNSTVKTPNTWGVLCTKAHMLNIVHCLYTTPFKKFIRWKFLGISAYFKIIRVMYKQWTAKHKLLAF